MVARADPDCGLQLLSGGAESAGEARPGYTSGDAIAEMERLAGKLPRGFGYEWTGQSLQEKLSGSQAPFLLGLSIFVVFLCLAALYESWTIPLAVLLTVPLGVTGAVVAAMLRGLPNDVYFTVGLITIIGLAAKDAILIIEFAKDLRKAGQAAGRSNHRSLPTALPSDPDDRPRLHLRRGANGDRAWRRRRQPAIAWHHRDGRHDRRRRARALDGAGVLCLCAAPAGGDRDPAEKADVEMHPHAVVTRAGGHPVFQSSCNENRDGAEYWIIRLRG